MKYDSIKRKIFFSKITWLKMASVVSCRLAASGQSGAVDKIALQEKCALKSLDFDKNSIIICVFVGK